MSAQPTWAWGVTPQVAELDCHGGRHTVSWRWGHLVLDDHHLGAEAVLEALGGEPAPCLAVLTAWRKAVAEDRERVGFRRRDPALPAALQPAIDQARLARRLRAWRTGALDRRELPRLHRQLLEEVRLALAAAVAPHRRPVAGSRVELTLHPLEPGEDSALEVEVRPGRVRVELSTGPTWLLEVAARGLARLDAGLVVEVAGADRAGGCVTATVLHWPADQGLEASPTVETLVLRRDPARGWTVLDRAADAPSVPRSALWWRVRTSR